MTHEQLAQFIQHIENHISDNQEMESHSNTRWESGLLQGRIDAFQTVLNMLNEIV